MHQAEMLRQRVEQFAIAIARLCDGLQSEPRATALAVQLRDAATSVSMNYRAACRARSHDEFVAKICVVVEEADEVVGWLNLLAGIGRSSGPEHQRLAQEAVELLRIFAASKRTAINNQQRRRAHKPRRRQ